MDDEPVSTTLAYTKSPKTSRRTTFQDELKKAVSARANRHSYSDDFENDDDEEDCKGDDDDDDDILNKLIKTQKQKKERFKAGKTKGKINDFKLSDDEDENVKPKKVSFMKTKRTSSPLHLEQPNSTGSADGQRSSFHSSQSRNSSQSPSNSYTPEKNQQSDSPFSSLSDKYLPETSLLKNEEQLKSAGTRNQTESSMVRKSLSESPLPLNSENSQWDSSIPFTSEGSQWDSPVPLPSEKDEDKQKIEKDDDVPVPQPRERSVKSKLPTGCLLQDLSPRPKPRQKTSNLCDTGQLEEETKLETPDCSRTATSSMSIAFSNRSSSEKSQASTNECTSVQGPDGDQTMTERSFLSAEQVSENPAIAGSDATEESKERNYSTSFEEKPESSQGDLEQASTTPNHMSRKITDRPSSSQSSSSRKSKRSYKAESKYLGTLKILDQTQQIPEAADSLRAAVYQEWLKKKEETLEITRRAKKQEQKLKEEKIQEEKLSKTADAKASYDAWKEKKRDFIRKKVKEKQKLINQQQMEMDKKQEKKETAKQVFEKWKEEQDSILKDKIREKKQAERKQKLQQVTEKEERKMDCTSAFTKWSDQKKDVIEEKVREERRKQKIKEVEEQYEKEEKDKMALEMYDKWLRRKEFQQERERKEKRIQAILQEEPPPPWSPPNKTIPFGK